MESLLTLPEYQLHRLFVWGDKRIRTKRAALDALPRAPDSLATNARLRELARDVASRSDIEIDESLSEAPDRLLFLAAPRNGFSEALSWLLDRCRVLGLTVFDPERERLLLPGSSVNAPRNSPKDRLVEGVADVLRSSELTDDPRTDALELTRNVIAVTGGRSVESLAPSTVAVPFDVPVKLRFMLPAAVPPHRQSMAAKKRYLKALDSPASETRRAAAFDLGGWPPSDEIDARLGQMLESEADLYVRAAVALSLAIRRTANSHEIVRAATKIVGQAEVSKERFSGIAASMAVLAAAIRSASQGEANDQIAQLASRVRSMQGEDGRGEALMNLASEHFGIAQ